MDSVTRVTAAQLAEQLQLKLLGNGDLQIEDAQSLDDAGPSDVTFLSSANNIQQLSDCRADAIVATDEIIAQTDVETQPACWLVSDDPMGTFIRILNIIRPRRRSQHKQISPQASVAADAQIGEGTAIAPNVFIDSDVRIGSNCVLHPGVHIGRGCTIGDDVVVHPNAVLYDAVEIGNKVTINASAVIGADGFGYRVVEGRHQRLEHFGTVVIEDEVEIGACATVDRGMIGETRIGTGTKIDNLVMIAHNCRLGPHNILVSQVGFAGSVSTGEYVVCAGQVGIGDHVHLGDHSIYGAKAGVHKDMPGHATYIGAPAEPDADAFRTVMALKKLPQMRRQLKKLQQQVETLSSNLEESRDTTSHAA